MLLIVVTVIPLLIIFCKSLRLQPLPAWAGEARMLSVFLCLGTSSDMAGSKRKCCPREENEAGQTTETSVMDLPDLALELILGKLPPAALCSMAGVCSSMRDMCRSDYLWGRHMREKWGPVVGPAARREWDWCLSTRRDPSASPSSVDRSRKRKRWLGSLSRVWPLSWLRSRLDSCASPTSPVLDESVMSWYLSLQSGNFWFPAQVYNRENGHVGFMLSCYDAEVRYDRRTDTFQAKYPPHGRRAAVVEEGVGWDRIRAPPVDTPALDLHVSDCLHDLLPGDHIEIQWRRNKEFPYGWWYGVVGHSEPCDGSEHFCRCHLNDTVALEFNHYATGSRWRRTTINRKDHREEGNETVGFYGGIRKLCSKDEISTWKQLWPVDAFE